MALTYAFGGNTGETPETVKRKRAIAEALLMSRGTPRNIGEGLNALGDGIVANVMGRRADKAESEGMAGANSAFAPILAALGGGEFPKAPAPSGGADYASRRVSQAHGDAGQVRQGLIQRGLPEHVADAFVMNFKDESNLNPGINEAAPIVPGSRGGFGLAQWTGPRRKSLEAFAAERGVPASDMDAQLDFLMTELQGPESGAFKAIMSAPDSGSAAAAIVNKFLRPAEEHRARREARYTGGGTQVASLDPSIGMPDEQQTAGISFTPPQQAQQQQLPPQPAPQPNPQIAQALSQQPERNPMSGNSDIPGLGMLLGAAQHPFMNENQSAIIQALTGQRMKEMDPMTGLERRKMELELRNLENPQLTPSDQLAREKFEFEKQNAKPDAPNVQTFYDEQGREYKAQWNGSSWEPVGGAKAPSGFSIRSTPDGGFEMVQGNGKLTENQSKLTLFQSLQTETQPVLLDLEKQFDPANIPDAAARSAPIGGNFFQSEQGQIYSAAATAWAEGALRIATGAAATPEEMERTKKAYFAQPGDTPNTIAFKAQMREMYNRSINRALGKDAPGTLPNPSEFANKFEDEQAEQGGVPEAGAVIDGYRFKGGDPADQNSWEPVQ